MVCNKELKIHNSEPTGGTENCAPIETTLPSILKYGVVTVLVVNIQRKGERNLQSALFTLFN